MKVNKRLIITMFVIICFFINIIIIFANRFADVNNDGVLDKEDVSIIAKSLLDGDAILEADMDNDGYLKVNDVTSLLNIIPINYSPTDLR